MKNNDIIQGTKVGAANHRVAKQLPTNSKSPKSGSSDDTLTKAMKLVNRWLAYRKQLIPSWERDTKLYNNERVSKHYEGVADTFVPMTFSTIETMYSALATGDLSTDFVPQDIYKYLKDRLKPGFVDNGEETFEQYLVRAIKNAISGGVIEDESLEVINALYDFYYDDDDWGKKSASMIKSGLRIGNGSLWMTWENGAPHITVVPFPDFIFDPDATDDRSCRFMGRRYLASLSEMRKEQIVNPITGKAKKRYNLKGISSRSTPPTSNEKTDKQLKEEMLFGSTRGDDDKNDQVEVIELRYDDRMVTIVNRKCVAEDVENPIITQAKLRDISTDDLILLPGITWANYEDDSLYIGKSETSVFWKEQERLNDSTNQKSDAVTRALLQQQRADPALKSQKNSFNVPGAVIWASANQYEPMPPAQVPGAAFSEEMSIKNNIRESTATGQLSRGVGSTKDMTATEANIEVAGSSQRLEIKVESLTRGPFKRMALLALQYIRLFVVDPFIIPQKENSGINPLLYDPSRYDFPLKPKVTLTVSAKNQRREEQAEARESYQLLIADPTNNLEETKKIMLPKMVSLDKDEIRRIITPPAPSPGGATSQLGGVPPENAMNDVGAPVEQSTQSLPAEAML